jgi:hypothetical protein
MKFKDFRTEEKVRLDPKCWTGKKIGNPKTKVKGGVRVNNCVPAESVEEAVNPAQQAAIAIAKKKKKQGLKEGTDNPYGYRKGQTVKLGNGQQGRVIDIFDDSIEVLLVGGRTVTVDFRDARVIDEQGVAEATGDEKFDKSMRQMTGKITPDDAAEMWPTQEFEPYNLDPSRVPNEEKYKAKLFPLAYQYWTEGNNADELRALGWEPDYGDDYVMVVLSGIGHDGHIQYDKYDFDAEGEDDDEDEKMTEGLPKYNPEYDDEAGMADNNLETLQRAVEGIDDLIQSGDNLPEWCQEKIAVAKSMLVAVWDYMYSEEASDEVDPEVDEMFEAMDQLAEEMAAKNRVSKDLVWEQFEAMPDNMLYETAAWRRSAGKSKKGGLNAKGVASYRRENPGSKLQMAVTTKPSKLKPGSKAAKRRKSFCARMGGVKGPMKKPNGKPTRKALALRKWNC